MTQSTNTILMVRPADFRANEETAVNNYFQDTVTVNKDTNLLAKAEFDNAVKTLEAAGVQVIVVEDSGKFDTPDSIFPNNVISFHDDKAILYPMFATNRRREIFLAHLGILEKHGIKFKTIKDYSLYADQEIFLEGTGVLILDRENKIAYCSISERANESLVQLYCEDNGYQPIIFHATQEVEKQRLPIYHTNVMMALGSKFCVICLNSIQNTEEQNQLIQSLESTQKTIIPISEAQIHSFCGNILELKNKDDETLIVMSEQAYKAFSEEQKQQLSNFGQLVYMPIYTIEKFGGGSIRCMIAEVFHT